MRAVLALLGLAACGGGPDPVGNWTGVVALEDTEGDTYVNEMVALSDGSGSAKLYSLLEMEDPETGDEVLYIAESTFTLHWQDAEDVTFALSCTWSDCVYNPAMDCFYADEGMTCDMLPDFYAEDLEVLQWLPA